METETYVEYNGIRTDEHRPSAIIPADYEYVGIEFMKIESFDDCFVIEDARAQVKAHMARTGGTYSNHQHGGSCHICGAGCVYTVLFYHPKSNVYIRTGNDCAQKLDMAFDQNAFKRFVAGVKGAREAQAGKKKARVLLADNGISAAWDILAECQALRDAAQKKFEETDTPQYKIIPYEEMTIEDIVRKVITYGNISPKAVDFVKVLLKKIEDRPVIAAQRAAEMESAEPCIAGRVVITGRVLAIKTVRRAALYHGDDGLSTKMLIQDLRGFKVWGSRIICAEKGNLITFTATVEVSKDDAKFGFFSRPTKGFFVIETTGELISQDQKRCQMFNCKIERRVIFTHSVMDLTGKITPRGTSTKIGPCGTPLFSEREIKTGICKSCYSGWSVEGNSLTARGHAEVKAARS